MASLAINPTPEARAWVAGSPDLTHKTLTLKFQDPLQNYYVPSCHDSRALNTAFACPSQSKQHVSNWFTNAPRALFSNTLQVLLLLSLQPPHLLRSFPRVQCPCSRGHSEHAPTLPSKFLRPSLTDIGDPWLDARSLTSCSTLPFAPVPRSPSGLLPACPRLTGDSDITP
jgi:hypothetical protein